MVNGQGPHPLMHIPCQLATWWCYNKPLKMLILKAHTPHPIWESWNSVYTSIFFKGTNMPQGPIKVHHYGSSAIYNFVKNSTLLAPIDRSPQNVIYGIYGPSSHNWCSSRKASQTTWPLLTNKHESRRGLAHTYIYLQHGYSYFNKTWYTCSKNC